jgi:hypothetical protein
MVICPWPVGIPPPARLKSEVRGEVGQPFEADKTGEKVRLESLTYLRLREVTTARFHRAFRQIQRTFARLKVPVVCAQDRDPVRLILARLERLRGLGIRR